MDDVDEFDYYCRLASGADRPAVLQDGASPDRNAAGHVHDADLQDCGQIVELRPRDARHEHRSETSIMHARHCRKIKHMDLQLATVKRHKTESDSSLAVASALCPAVRSITKGKPLNDLQSAGLTLVLAARPAVRGQGEDAARKEQNTATAIVCAFAEKLQASSIRAALYPSVDAPPFDGGSDEVRSIGRHPEATPCDSQLSIRLCVSAHSLYS